MKIPEIDRKKIKPQIISEHNKQTVDKFKELYEKDKIAARISSMTDKVYLEKTILFETSKTRFIIVKESEMYGVSISYKVYFRRKIHRKIYVNDGKFYVLNNIGNKKTLLPLTYYELTSEEESIIYERIPWIRFFKELQIKSPFNLCKTHKIYNPKKILCHIYCVKNGQTALNIHRNMSDGFTKKWRLCVKWMENIENINIDLLADKSFFFDCLEMAEKLNRKINVSWSYNRFRNEHDKMSKIITDILFDCNNRKMLINSIFYKFKEFCRDESMRLLETTKDLSLEGRLMKHCVAGYVSNVEYGQCAIFNFRGYTAELKNYGSLISLGQFKGYANSDPPQQIRNELLMYINSFNDWIEDENKAVAYPSEGQLLSKYGDLYIYMQNGWQKVESISTRQGFNLDGIYNTQPEILINGLVINISKESEEIIWDYLERRKQAIDLPF